jgi:hydroxymethylpyrimidine/phosphomethylpyrimidine kinase
VRIVKATESACVLAIGGLDPGGGAGLAADLRAIGAAGAFGCAAIAVMTVQSTSGLRAVTPIAPRQVAAQGREVLRHQRVRAIKTGALGSAANVRAVADLAARHPEMPTIVDPVLAPTRGRARLLAERAVDAMRSALIPHAALVTANVAEAEALTGRRVTNVSEAHDAALALCRLGARAALVKGGHLEGAQAIDVLAIPSDRGHDAIEIRAKRLRLPPVHGGGCTFASLVAARMALDRRPWPEADPAIVIDAIRWAKRAHHRMLAAARDVGGAMRVLVP